MRRNDQSYERVDRASLFLLLTENTFEFLVAALAQITINRSFLRKQEINESNISNLKILNIK